MKKVEINEEVFKKLMDGVKHATGKNGYRPILQNIMLVVKKDSVTTYALDGYRAGKIQVQQKNNEEFTCYFKPFSFKPTKRGIFNVVVEYDEKENVYITTATDFGEMRYCFIQPNEKFVNIEKIYQDVENRLDRKIGVTSAYTAQALKAVGSMAIIHTSPDNKQAFIIKSMEKNIINEQLVLPVRIDL